MRPVYVLGVHAHPWGKHPDKPQLQLALEALTGALGDAGLGWRDLGGLVAASSRFEGGLGSQPTGFDANPWGAWMLAQLLAQGPA